MHLHLHWGPAVVGLNFDSSTSCIMMGDKLGLSADVGLDCAQYMSHRDGRHVGFPICPVHVVFRFFILNICALSEVMGMFRPFDPMHIRNGFDGKILQNQMYIPLEPPMHTNMYVSQKHV